MSKFYASLVAFFSVVMLGSAAWATPVGLTSEGFVGSVSSTTKATLISQLNSDLGRSDVVFLGSASRLTSTLNAHLFRKHAPYGGDGVSMGDLAYTGGTGGTWAFDPGQSPFDVAAILIVVRGQGYLYLSNGFANNGFWNVDDFAGILAKKLAHNSRLPRIFFFGVDPPRDDVGVPEPFSLALLGGGLLALVMLGRRRRISL